MKSLLSYLPDSGLNCGWTNKRTNQISNILMWIKDIEIENYKSIKDQHLSPSELTVLVGKNNTGKSNVIDALADFQFSYDRGVNWEWTEPRIFDKNLDYSVNIGLHVVLEEDEYDRLLHQFAPSFQENCREQGWLREARIYQNYGEGMNADQDVILNLRDDWKEPRELADQEYTRGKPEVVFDILSTSVESWTFIDPFRQPRDTHNPSYETEVKSDGKNLIRVLGAIERSSQREKFSEIREIYTNIMEGVTDLHIEWVANSTGQEKITVVIEEDGFTSTFTAEDMSSGAIQILLLITQIVLSEDNADLLIIEEPELHLHPGAEKEIFDLIRDVADEVNGPQIIVSTHSEVFVDNIIGDNIVSVNKDRETILDKVDSTSWDESVALGIDKSSLVQSDTVVFVEGRTDKAILEQFAKSLSKPLENNGIEVIIGNGDELKSGGRYVDILRQLSIPYLFILDSDGQDPSEKRNRFASKIGVSPENVHVLNKYSIESYLTSPEVIATVIDSDEELIRQQLEGHNPTNTNMKPILDDLYSDLVGISFDPEQNGAMIARNMDKQDIDDEIEELIIELTSLSE